MRRIFLSAILGLAALALLVATPAAASNFCPHGGKNYTPGATRCENGKKLRCQKGNVWKEIGKCKAPAAKKGPVFCPHGGKHYSPGSTRCENGKKLRCVKDDEWKEIGKCK